MRAGAESLQGEVEPTVLIVDDSGLARRRLLRFLRVEGWAEVLEASDGRSALESVVRHRPALVLLDQVMRGMEGIEAARRILDLAPETCVVMLTAVADTELRERALRTGIREVIDKNAWERLKHVLGHVPRC